MQQYMINTKQIEGNNILLSKEDLHHIYKVMRMRVNDLIECVNYETQVRYLAKIIDDSGTVIVVEELESNNELKKELVLAYGLVKADKFEFVIQKAAELGASKLIPIMMKYSVVKYDEKKLDKKMERWYKISKEACEQSHRNTIMEICKPIGVEELVNEKFDLNIVAYENEDSTNNILNVISKDKSVLVVVGPEGGISLDEYQYLINHDFLSISLGKRILRTETAAISTLSIISNIME